MKPGGSCLFPVLEFMHLCANDNIILVIAILFIFIHSFIRVTDITFYLDYSDCFLFIYIFHYPCPVAENSHSFPNLF